MNLHPIFVHFPIALLTIYSVMEVLRFRALRENRAYQTIKAFLAIFGTLAIFAALQTGDMARAGLDPSVRPVLRLHSDFASYTATVYSLIAASYLIVLISRFMVDHPENLAMLRSGFLGALWSVLGRITRVIQKPFILIVLAILGLILITVTGALGGLMVYGPNVDPAVQLVAHIFFPGTY